MQRFVPSIARQTFNDMAGTTESAPTKLVPDQPLIVGFNWGVDKKNGHDEPTGFEYPNETFADLVSKPTELGSLGSNAELLKGVLGLPST